MPRLINFDKDLTSVNQVGSIRKAREAVQTWKEQGLNEEFNTEELEQMIDGANETLSAFAQYWSVPNTYDDIDMMMKELKLFTHEYRDI